MAALRLLIHAPGAPGLRWFGLGPDLRRLLAVSSVVVSLWQGKRLGRQLVEALLAAPALRGVTRTYLMTTNSASFYRQLGFSDAAPQELLVKQSSSTG